MSDAVLTLLGVNVVVAVTVGLVMALRLPVRRLFGARVAYGLWSLVPLASLALLLPARVVRVAVSAAPQTTQMIFEPAAAATNVPTAPVLLPLAVALWIAGALISLGCLVWRQLEFSRAARDGLAGPAVIGLLRPRIVTPFDFGRRYTPREQLVVLAHEAAHIRRHDTWANAALALAACVNWFNPAMHLFARYLRIDQEFACDAQVMAAHPTARRSYAEAMLKTQLAARALPLGCYWPAQSPHPLAQRIELLARHDPGRGRRLAGTAAVALLGVTGAVSAWAARPPEVVTVAAEPEIRSQSTNRAAPRPVAKWPASGPAKLVAARAVSVQSPDGAAEAARLSAEAAAVQAASDAQAVSAPAASQPQLDPPLRMSKIRSLARRSTVEPGSAVRVFATMVDPEGRRLTTDLTAFGSQSAYRKGWFERDGSRQSLFTSVYQDGDRFTVSASLDRRFESWNSGSIVLAAGQTGQIVLGNGQVVTVTPTVRRETPAEVEEGQRATRDIAFFGGWGSPGPRHSTDG
jgi:beta-lactamase regulating signal transducer with metallopeptidase domain